MSALAQCDAFAFIYDQAGDPAPDILVVLKRVLDASGNPILLSPKTTTTDSAGSFHFTLPELSTAFISARATALWNCPDGRAFKVPPGPAGELVPDFSLPASTLVQPPLVYVGDVLSIPKASETQDGYLSAADFVRFEAEAAMGVNQIDTGAGLTGGPITDAGTISLAPIPGVAGTWANPSSITVNGYGQVIAISGVADTTAPAISAISATPTSSGATIIWTTDDFSDSQVEYGTTTSYGSTTTIATTPVTSHSVPITGTASSTLYHYRVKSRNTAGLLTTSGDNTFTTLTGPDVTAPVISAVASSALTTTGATITWTTDELSDSQVEYGPTTSYGSSTTPDATMVTSHSVPLTLLTASTLYHYRVKSKDAASNLQTSPDHTFTTATPPVDTSSLLVNLVSYWKFEEASGTRMDEVGPNDLTVAGTVSSVPGITGLPGTLAVYGGSGVGWLNAVDDPSQYFTGSMSIAGWMALHTLITPPIEHYMLSKFYAGTGFNYGVEWRETDNAYKFVAAEPDGVTLVYASIANTPTLDEFVFVAAVFDYPAGEIRLSLNAGTPVTVPFPGPINAGGTSTLQVLAGNGVLADMYVDELGLWGKALTATEIGLLYHGGAGRTHPFT
jgi:hypothetical protein